MQEDLCYNGCDCEDEESCQAIHCPSCKRQGPSDLCELSFQKEALRDHWLLRDAGLSKELPAGGKSHQMQLRARLHGVPAF